DLGPPDDQADLGPLSPTFQGRVNGGIARPDNGQFLVGIEMGVLVVMGNLGQVLPGNTKGIGQVIESGGHYHVLGPVACLVRSDVEGFRFFLDREHPFKEFDVQFIGGYDPTVVFQGLVPFGLGLAADERDVVDFQFLRGGEELHVYRVVEQRIHQGPFFYNEIVKPVFLGLKATGNANGTPTDDKKVEQSHYWVL